MRIAIMGSGGMGGFIGAKLAGAGHDVIFIARGKHLNALKSSGLKLLSKEGNLHVNPVEAYENTQDVGVVDLIIFSVKLYDTEQAAKACLPMMGDKTFILTLQNGVQSVEIISQTVGNDKTIGGSIYVSANIDSPGVIKHSGGNNTIHFAELCNRKSTRTDILEQLFPEAGLIGIRAENLQEMLWTKFILLCANASIGSLTDSGAVTMCRDPDTKEILLAAMWEVYHVATAMGISLNDDAVEKNLDLILSVGKGKDLMASQCLDLRQGNRLELEWIQGTVHRLGKKYNVPTPVNSTAYVALKRFSQGGNKGSIIEKL
ncbi:MAG: 2-dehydropantoate 2-reductase [Emcibacter sp.]|nr:2-dehydropantoate 2-reductase [Emcibacter sp.]